MKTNVFTLVTRPLHSPDASSTPPTAGSPARRLTTLAVLTALLAVSTAQADEFKVVNTADSGPGSLRQAILRANANPGLDRIVFKIPGPGVHTITPTSGPLPDITGPVVIDGFTQPGAEAATEGEPGTVLIAINGEAVSAVGVDGVGYYAVLGGFGVAAVSGPLAVLLDPASPYGGLSQVCDPLPAGSLAGKIALISRGTCAFSTKLRNLQAAGAIGVIVVNREGGGNPFAMGQDGTPNQPTIPAFMVSLADRTVLMTEDGKAAFLNPAVEFPNGLTLGEASGGSTIRGLAIQGCPAGAGIAVLPHLKNLAEADVLIASPTSVTASGSIYQADLADAYVPASGDWTYDNPIPGGGGSYYAFRATGMINVATKGDYTFALGSDDGSRLRIDGSEIVAYPSPRSFADSFGTVHLTAGKHSVEWTGFQVLGAAGFEVSLAAAGAALPVSAPNGWNVLGDPTAATGITLVGPLAVTVYYEAPLDPTLDTILIEGDFITGNHSLGGIDNEGGLLTVNSTALTGNSAQNNGGGILNNGGTLAVNNSTLRGNSAQNNGGGVFNNFATLTIQESTLSGNSAAWGAGIENFYGTVTVSRSTLSGNSAQYASGIDNTFGTVTVNNSTMSGNSAQNNGGGIGSNWGWLTVQNSTLSGNSAPDSSGIWNEFGSAPFLVLANSIVAGNVAESTIPDLASGIYIWSNGHNLIGNGDGASGYLAGDQVGTTAAPLDPKLSPLQNNGGPTLTHALLPGSPAIDAGATADAVDPYGAPLTTDQRGIGFPRVLGSAVDIGAFEYGTPQQRIAHLISEVNSLALSSGIQNALLVKLNAALADLGRGKTTPACNDLGAFINLVNAQAGKALAASVADGLSAEAMAIQSALGCE